LGSLIAYVTDSSRRDFQPMNANYGLFPALEPGPRGRARRAALGQRALHDGERWMGEHGLSVTAPPRSESATSIP
jgi:methylenetetrahydrofolate--tRNA-(uracil-5-)-methyltransferase